MKPKKPTILSVYFTFWLLVGACTEGAVSDLLGTESQQKEDFSSVDDGVKAKFTKLETIQPDQILTLKVELFSFLSSDDLRLTNLSPLSFVPSRFGVEKLAEGLKFKNGFISEVQLIDSLSCGRLILSDLKIILCPGSINVAYATDQNPHVSLGTDLANMMDVSQLAKKTQTEFSELEGGISVALSERLETSEQTTQEAAGEDVIVQIETSPSPTPIPEIQAEQVGLKPTSHVLKEKLFLGGGAGTGGARVKFAKDYIVFVYKTRDDAAAFTVQIYDKDFTNGFTLLNETNLFVSFTHVDALNVSSNGKRIYIAGRRITGVDGTSWDLVFVQKAYDPVTNSFSVENERNDTITNSSFGSHNQTNITELIHVDEARGEGYFNAIATGWSTSPVEKKLFIIEGQMGVAPIYWAVTPVPVPISGLKNRVRLIKMFLDTEDNTPTYFAMTGDGAPSEGENTVLLKIERSNFVVEKNYNQSVFLDLMELIQNSLGVVPLDAKPVNATDLYTGFFIHKSGGTGSVGIARIDSAGRVVWPYDVDVWLDGTNTFNPLDVDYDANRTGNLVGVLYKNTGVQELKLFGLKLTY